MLADLGSRPTGAQIDDHLRFHGLEPWSVPNEPRVVVFWEQEGGALPQPVAVLVDAGEPLSRFRDYPELVADSSGDEVAKRWVLAQREWLTVRTGGDPGLVQGTVYAPGCQRAVIVLQPGARGKHFTADLVTLGMGDLPFLGQAERQARLVDLTFSRAPWEEQP
jgi:sirohydrochlorin ferrochelatase